MTDRKTLLTRVSSLLKKNKAVSDSVAKEPDTHPDSQTDLLSTKLAEADHNVSDFTQGLNASPSPIAPSQTPINGERFLAAHLVGYKDTLSGIAFKYYGKASEPYYRLIYEANREIIGSNMNLLRAGQTLNIPKLPEELINN